MFPLGIGSYLIGGILVGTGVSLIYVSTGLHATQSSFFTTTLSWVSKRNHFQKESIIRERNWRLILAIGLIIGALTHTLMFAPNGFWTTTVQFWRLALGGLLIGFGTRLSQGCTSGHGISGLASLSTTSLYAVVVFMTVAIVTASTVRILGIFP